MTIADRVKNILSASVEARNSDKALLKIYMLKSGLDLTSKQMDLLIDMPSFETITRVRRDVQAKGQYTASEGIRRQRKAKSLVVQQNAPTASTHRLEQILEDGTIITYDGRRVLDD